VGFCHGIENYSRALSGRPPGSRPWCLLDHFPSGKTSPHPNLRQKALADPPRIVADSPIGEREVKGTPLEKRFLTFIDESHATLPQLRGMYEGDRARKEILVRFGFRLPSCLDNRPLKFQEFEKLMGQEVFVSATPSPYEFKASGGKVVQQVIRPTGLVDPEIEVRPIEGQVDNLIHEVRERARVGERVLVTTLTKRMAEDLATYLKDANLKVTYIHSDLDAFERVEVLRNLRLGTFDCVVGINLLREGLDLPEVSLVCVLDADKEGFLRSATTLIQVTGRAARHLHSRVILYADQVTHSMKQAMDETDRRRKIQLAFNEKNNITPRSIEKAIREGIEGVSKEDAQEEVRTALGLDADQFDLEQVIAELEEEMELAARNLQFERAAALRDQAQTLREKGVSALADTQPKREKRKKSKRWKRNY